MTQRYLAVDLGAESGRVIAGALTSSRITLEELHRFENTPLHAATGLHWDLPLIQAGILEGLRRAGHQYGDQVTGIGVDAWGCDYGLLDAGGALLGPPFHYRNVRTDGLRERAALLISPEEQYRRTGIAQLPFNTVYQLMAEREYGERRLERAATLLQMPDLLHYWLCGERASEITNASTTGALGVDGHWAADLLARLGAPSHMLLPTIEAGTTLGVLRSWVQEQCGLGPVSVIAPPTHDTASAVVAVPALDADYAYISSGTWSLLGVELQEPVVSEAARLAGFTNERGIGGTFRFLSNIMGLWLVQECRRSWARQGFQQGYGELTSQTARVASPEIVIDVDDPAFLHPDDMPAAIAAQIERAGIRPLTDPVGLTRAILEGLALQYRLAVATVERLTGKTIRAIHIVGGGSRNGLLCQLTADACGLPAIAGPAEATALGNILVQAMGQGVIRDLQEARAMVRASFAVKEYGPTPGIDWVAREAELLSRRHP
ncbi:MAG TPA: rhamnulokinase family protein [Chloroflexota bacterium]|nr:rhamnulokinase family protein [Chloroflexota bacterium]